MKKIFLILLVLSAVLFTACEIDPLEKLFDVWDDETVASTGDFDLYDTTNELRDEEPEETEEDEENVTGLPTVELPVIPG